MPIPSGYKKQGAGILPPPAGKEQIMNYQNISGADILSAPLKGGRVHTTQYITFPKADDLSLRKFFDIFLAVFMFV